MTSADTTDESSTATGTIRGGRRHLHRRDLWSNPYLLTFVLVWLAASAYIIFLADLAVLHHVTQ